MWTKLWKLLSDSGLYALGDIIVKGLPLVLSPLFIRYITQAEYGIYTIAVTVSTFMTYFYSSFSYGAVTRFYLEHKGDQSREFLGTVWVFGVAQSLLFSFLVDFAGSNIASVLFREVPYVPYLRYAVWTSCISSIALSVPQPLFRAQQNAVMYFVFTVPFAFLRIILILYLLIWQEQGLIGIFRGELLATFIFLVPALYIILRNVRVSINWAYMRMIVLFGIPLMFSQFAQWGLKVSDRVLLERYVSIEEVAIYSFGYLFGTALSVLVSAINVAWVPFFIAHVKEQEAGKKVFVGPVVTYLIGIMIAMVAMMLALAEPALRMLASSEYYSALRIIPWVSIGVLALGLYSIPASVLFYRQRVQQIAVCTIVGSSVNVLLNLWWIPGYGMMAAAINTCIAYWIMFGLALYFARDSHYFRYEMTRIVKLLCSFGLASALGSMVQSHNPLLELILRETVLLGSGFFILWFGGFFSVSEIDRLRRLFGAVRQTS